MKANREILEDQLESHQEHLKSLNSFIKELNKTADECGTDRAQIEEDLVEAEHNVEFYEADVSRIKKELGGLGKATGTPDEPENVLPQTVKQGVGALILSSISFAAGALLGSKLKTRRGGEDQSK
jgi:chromosome segregation ATPase